MKFKVGDRVKYIGKEDELYNGNMFNRVLTITSIVTNSEFPIETTGDPKYTVYRFSDEELCHVYIESHLPGWF